MTLNLQTSNIELMEGSGLGLCVHGTDYRDKMAYPTKFPFTK